ncbi:TetR/AcrR family transcriptional regulator [Duganella aceris]|uniref:TetR/AcrR family transcriptional regulator n=1 Tax=Duganella aceris TaxID=2703883 RepID=A0ABX0FUQ3_9BURK|nr:TetR/AcrR family transcriptional regulator [Duganella aceris]NGZ88110.1 TetR/AcrR family transcriptional regulator [Duganella aceris]
MAAKDKTPGSRKEALTGLAVDMMQTSGFSALALRDLAQKACMQAASLYSHFDSKNALARQAMALYAQRQREDLADIDRAPSGHARLHRYVEMFAATLGNDNRLCLGLMLAVERNAIPEEVMQEIRLFSAQNIAWLDSAWELGRADGTVRSAVDGKTAAPMIFGAAEGMMAFALLEPEPAPAFRRQLGGLLAALGVQA